jgi:hypothetical protein
VRILSVIVCLFAIGLVAGCGDEETKTVTQPVATPPPTTPTTPPETTTQPPPEQMMDTGPAGTMGPPQGGEQYDATDPTVLSHIEDEIKEAVARRGISNAQVRCTGDNPSQATCVVTNPANGRSVTVTVAVNQQTGALRITNVTQGG